MKSGRKTPVLILSLLLPMAATACNGGSPTGAPPAPTVTPSGPNLTLEPGAEQTLRASSQDAEDYEWVLQGEGRLSPSQGESVLFTAPSTSGSVAVVTVTAQSNGRVSRPTTVVLSIAATPAVRVDSLGVPAGWMTGSDGDDPSPFMELRSEPGACRTGAECVKVAYRPGGVWGGIWWWPQGCGPSGTPDAWQRFTSGACAVDVRTAGPLTSIRKLTLWARGARGGEVVEFKVGASEVLPKPGRSTGKVALSDKWQYYEIDLGGLETARIVGLFAWIAADLDNPQGATFYLDDIQFEGER